MAPPEDEGLGNSVRGVLDGIGDRDPELVAIAQQPAERLGIGRGGNDEYVAYAHEHERGEWLLHRRLVVNRDQLLAHPERGSGAIGIRFRQPI